MKPILKIMLLLGLFFSGSFFILNLTGILTLGKIEGWLLAAQSADPLYVGLIVAALLCADLIFTVPTLATMMLAGYFIGAFYAALAGTIGLMMAGIGGYLISRHYGEAVMRHMVKDENERAHAIASFHRHGPIVILLSRALPVLPEVSACMAGLTRLPFFTFVVLWAINVVPYTLITAYAGSMSSLDNPQPALLTAIGLSVFFWSGWAVFNRWKA